MSLKSRIWIIPFSRAISGQAQRKATGNCSANIGLTQAAPAMNPCGSMRHNPAAASGEADYHPMIKKPNNGDQAT